MTNQPSEAERDAAIVMVKTLVGIGVTSMIRYAEAQGLRFTATPVHVDGGWQDYWCCDLDGLWIGDIGYGPSGPVIDGDRLADLAYETMLADQRAAASHHN